MRNKEIEESNKESEGSFINILETESREENEEQRETVAEDDEDDLCNAMNRQGSSTCVAEKRKKKGRKSY